jgi:hypothetical protein
MIVVAEDADDGRVEARDDRLEVAEIHLAVADEVAGEADEIGRFGVGPLDGGAVDAERRDAPDVEIGEVRDAETGDRRGVGGRAGEATEGESNGALGRSGRELSLLGGVHPRL